MLASNLSVVVSLTHDDLDLCQGIFEQFVDAEFSCELVMVCPMRFSEFQAELSDQAVSVWNQFMMLGGASFEYVRADRASRALQYNLGVERSSRPWVWLLHIDSKMSRQALNQVVRVTEFNSDSPEIFYFSLNFCKQSSLSFINQFFGNLRADYLGMIYGDQSFLLTKDRFLFMSGFREGLAYGEDHDFVWRSRLMGYRWKRLKGRLQTSSRAYEGRWLELTLKRIRLGFSQAYPYQRKVFSNFFRKVFKPNRIQNIKLEKKTTKSTGGDYKVAIAVFVKTPGLSALKTRLAKGIGKLRAENFHLVSCLKIQKSIKEFAKNKKLTAYWAVAEEEAYDHPLWSSQSCIGQGELEFGLGQRLNYVYRNLIEKNDFVLLMGADSPQISAFDFDEAVESLCSGNDYFLGKAKDGGYYLFGGKKPISKELWLSVPYSTDKTAEVFSEKLKQKGSLFVSDSILEDVDTKDEFQRVTNQCF